MALGAALIRFRMWLVALGIALGIILIFLCAAPLSHGLPRPHPYAAISIIIAIIIEAIAFRIIMPRVRPLGDRQTGLTTLAIVSLHFLIMIFSFCPVIALLTALGLINVWLGWKRSDLRLNSDLAHRWRSQNRLRDRDGCNGSSHRLRITKGDLSH